MQIIKVGQWIEERYRVLRLLGEGAMGQVFLVDDENTETQRALKFTIDSDLCSTEAKRRFERELKICAEINHPNLVAFHDFGRYQGQLYYSMEYIAGPTLGELMDEGTKFSAKEVADVCRQLCSALSALHEKGVIHRDVKPDNIMLRKYPAQAIEVVLTDFGLAANLDGTAITETGFTIGTPRYMSPEQIRGHRLTSQADLFSIGIVIFQMLKGHHPFKGDTAGQLMAAIMSDEPEKVEGPWRDFFAASLAKKAEDRASSAKTLVESIPDVSKKQQSTKRAEVLPETQSVKKGRTPLLPILLLSVVIVVFVFSQWRAQSSDNFDVKAVKVESTSDTVKVSWQSSIAYPSHIAVLSAEKQVITTCSRLESKDHSLLLAGLTPAQVYTVRIVYPSGSTSLPISFRTEQKRSIALQKRTQTVINRLLNFDGKAVSRDAVVQMLTKTDSVQYSLERMKTDYTKKSRKAEFAAQVLSASLEASKIKETWAEAARISSEVLCKNDLNFELRRDFYRSLSRVLNVYWLSCHFRRPLQDIKPPILGPWGFSVEGLSGEVKESVLFTTDNAPVELVSGVKWNKGTRIKELSFLLTEEELQQIKEFELKIRVSKFRRGVLQLQLNDLPKMAMAGTTEALGLKVPDVHDLFQRIPKEGLKQGENRIVLRVVPLIGFAMADKIKIFRLAIRSRIL